MPLSAPDPDHRGRAVVVGLAASAAAGIVLSATIARGASILDARWTILVLLGAWAAAWALAVACALRLPRRLVLPLVFAAALALRLAALAGPPVLSDDLYRYSWDGRVQAAGDNPYRYPPSSAEAARLREPWLWPDEAGCAELERPPGCTRINRPAVRTIYPPGAQAWFSAVYRIAGIDARYKPWQVAGLITDMALVGFLPMALRAWGRDERWSAFYALSPFPALEVVNNGHVDGLAALLIVLALLLAARRRPAWTGALVGGAILVKLYPAVVVAGLAAHRGRARGWAGLTLGAASGVVVAGYLPHVISVGAGVLGYLPGYLEEEGYEEGGRSLLVGMLGLPGGATSVLAVAALVAAAVWIVVRRSALPRAWATLLGALLLISTPVQPWYAVTLLAAAAVAGRPAWALVAAGGYPYFFAVILGSPHAVAIGRASYGAALAGVSFTALAHHRRRPRDPRAAPTGAP